VRLSVAATLLLEDQQNPVAVSFEGPPSSAKTTLIDFLDDAGGRGDAADSDDTVDRRGGEAGGIRERGLVRASVPSDVRNRARRLPAHGAGNR
jgi:hypothetical protein